MHETFDHTADLGLRIRAADLDALFAEAAEALFEVVVENLPDVRLKQTAAFRLEATSLEYLFFDWLNELLLRFERDHLLFVRFAVKVEQADAGWKLGAVAEGEAVDPERHHLDHEVKAITYHGLKVEKQTDGGWLAEAIVDI